MIIETFREYLILVEKREKFLNAGYVAFIVPVCDIKSV